MNPAHHGPALVRLFNEGFPGVQMRPAGNTTSAHATVLNLAAIERQSGFVWQTPDGQIIGVVAILTHPTRRDTAIIANVVTDMRHRGRGIGRSLLQAAIAFARKQQLGFLALQVEKGNAPALRLYTSLGFEQFGEVGFYSVQPLTHAKLLMHPRPDGDSITVRRTVERDTPEIQRLMHLAIPEALRFADSVVTNQLISRLRNTGCVAERRGQILGAMTMDQTQCPTEQRLMLDPRCTPAQGREFLNTVFSHVNQKSQTQIVFVQSRHALNTLRALETSGFTAIRSTMHMRLCVSM